ncbi:alpha/beta hydrolase [Pedobacter xixiisoli]|uniref:Acetyl esterase/lipase n=1 Tax=Pedobacter xixiisoli TaxID=1476464 RepID=A0A286AAG6_9SPHI|nr:alpha/beta hydrolase [Pedobacter xixiisoli]SOD18903.1 Acetyl esterase/lipase [Pedobacter xixiisoli]
MKVLLQSVCIVILSVFVASCKKSNNEPPLEAKTMLNVSYGSNSLQKMDVYLPANRNFETKVIVFVHGGSFIEGDKSDYTTTVAELVKRNYAVVNINYRLVDGSNLQTHKQSAVTVLNQVDDLSLAIDYTIAQADEWQVNKSKIAVVGHSAGATLGLLYSYGNKNTGKVKVVANLAGALDQTFTDIPNYQFLPAQLLEMGYRYTGYEVNVANEQHYKAISPLYVANANQKVPTLTIFPQNNEVGGLPKQDRATFDKFVAKLNSENVPNKFVQIPGADHSFTTAGSIQLVFVELLAYLNANL